MSISYLVYASVKLVCGTLYPAFRSFKAVKTKNVKEYFQWMIYWIVFALVTVTEEVADLFLNFWFPLYYELKILFLVWLLSPSTRGATFLYRQVIHPTLSNREEDIDDFVEKCKAESYSLGVR
jgi:receptor expression-enhancing protein 1/2/3/4